MKLRFKIGGRLNTVIKRCIFNTFIILSQDTHLTDKLTEISIFNLHNIHFIEMLALSSVSGKILVQDLYGIHVCIFT